MVLGSGIDREVKRNEHHFKEDFTSGRVSRLGKALASPGALQLTLGLHQNEAVNLRYNVG